MGEPTRDEMIAALLEIAKTHGIVALIAVGMVYSMAVRSDAEHARILERMESVADIAGQSHMTAERTLYVLRRICVQEADAIPDLITRATARDACLKDRE